jgi:beta-N-acetylhexosaminidase
MDFRKKPFCLTESEFWTVDGYLSSLSLEQKIGQLFCVLGDLYPEETLEKMAQEKGIGGILFRPDTAENLRKKYAKLDALAKIPLLKAANLEDGASGAVKEGTRYSSELGVAATNDAAFARELALSASYEARKAGINITFSPDADIDNNPFNPITNERTYGSDPKKVALFVSTELKAFLENGLLTAVKHFPGDGQDFRDQHLLTSVNPLSAPAWEDSYGLVYRNAIASGVPAVMVGHIAAPRLAESIDPTISKEEAFMPASLSPELLQGVLRKKLGFEGLILSDATIMGGFTQALSREEALPRMILSGIDMIVFNADFEEDYAILLAAAKAGKLPEKRLDEAVSRILAAKILARRLAKKEAINVPSESRKRLAERSITLVKNQGGILPISPEKYREIELVPLGNDVLGDSTLSDYVKKRLEREGFSVHVFAIDRVEMHGPKSIPAKSLTLYLANLETASNQTAVRIDWAKKHALDSPRYIHETAYLFVSFANPFHLMDVPRVPVYINAYTANEDVVDSVIDKILGKSPFKGVSPVDAYCGMEDTAL